MSPGPQSEARLADSGPARHLRHPDVPRNGTGRDHMRRRARSPYISWSCPDDTCWRASRSRQRHPTFWTSCHCSRQLLLAYALTLIGKIDRQDFRLLAQSLLIRRRDAFMRQVLDNSVDGILILDLDRVVRDCNRAAGSDPRRWTPIMSRENHCDEAVEDVASPEDRAQVARVLQRHSGTHELELAGSQGDGMFVQVAISDTVVDDERNIIVGAARYHRRETREGAGRRGPVAPRRGHRVDSRRLCSL